MPTVASAAAAAASTITDSVKLVRVLILALTQLGWGSGRGVTPQALPEETGSQAPGWPSPPLAGTPQAWVAAVAEPMMHMKTRRSRRSGLRPPWVGEAALQEMGRGPLLEHRCIHGRELFG